jgi:hypothetical protein
LLAISKERLMAEYFGEVVQGSDDDFPFIAMISDQDGNVVGEFQSERELMEKPRLRRC